MNERIKQLAEQAGMRECSLGYGMPENVLWGENQIANFAELIVKECAKICSEIGHAHISDELDGSPEFGHGANWSAYRIKEHFGVEE
jgi:hypothetical protein